MPTRFRHHSPIFGIAGPLQPGRNGRVGQPVHQLAAYRRSERDFPRGCRRRHDERHLQRDRAASGHEQGIHDSAAKGAEQGMGTPGPRSPGVAGSVSVHADGTKSCADRKKLCAQAVGGPRFSLSPSRFGSSAVRLAREAVSPAEKKQPAVPPQAALLPTLSLLAARLFPTGTPLPPARWQ